MKPFITPIKTVWLMSTIHLLVAPYVVAAQTGQSSVESPAQLKAGVVTSPAPERTLSLATCFDKADLYNKELVSAKWNLPIAKAGIKIAGAIPNPQFELQAGFGPSFNELYTGQTQQIGWTQQFQTAAKRRKKIEVAKENYVLAQIQLEALRFSVHNRVRQAYAQQAASEAYADLIEAERAVGLKLLTLAERRVAAGKAPQMEVLQAKLNVSQFDTQRNQAQIRLQHATANLALIIGETPERIDIIVVDDNGLFKLSAEKNDIVPSPILTLPHLDQLIITANTSRPDLKAAQQQTSVNRKALTLARAQRIPDLFIGSGYTFMTTKKNQPEGLIYQPNWLGNGVFVNLTSETPVFYQHQGEVQQAIANIRQSENEADLLQCQVGTDVVTAYNEVIVARANIFAFQKYLLPTATQVAQLARRGYEVGKTDLATAIVAQQQYQQTLSSYFDAVVAYQSAWSNLEKAVGVPLKF